MITLHPDKAHRLLNLLRVELAVAVRREDRQAERNISEAVGIVADAMTLAELDQAKEDEAFAAHRDETDRRRKGGL